MPDKPKITVYVPSHNYGTYLEGAVESVLRQTVDNWELLIIDDGSTDDTAEVMALYAGDERIRCFTTGGVGLPAVCNLALREGRGEYLIRLDARQQLRINLSNPRIARVVCVPRHVGERWQHTDQLTFVVNAVFEAFHQRVSPRP